MFINTLNIFLPAHELIVFYLVTLGLFMYFAAWWKLQPELEARRVYR